MMQAPERIWAMAPHIGEYFADPPVTPEDKRFLTEYVRADLAAQAVQDVREAALREAAREVEKRAMSYSEDKPPDWEDTADCMMWSAVVAIEALIPPAPQEEE